MRNGISFLRYYLDVTLVEFGEMLGVSKGVICKWEAGQDPITQKRCEELSNMFGLNSEWLHKEVNDYDEIEILKCLAKHRKTQEGK